MTTNTFEMTRLSLIVIVMLIRVAVMPWYLQAYLNLAPKKLSRLRKESGRTKTDEIQKIVSYVHF